MIGCRHALQTGSMRTAFGWSCRTGTIEFNERSIRNLAGIKATGAELAPSRSPRDVVALRVCKCRHSAAEKRAPRPKARSTISEQYLSRGRSSSTRGERWTSSRDNAADNAVLLMIWS